MTTGSSEDLVLVVGLQYSMYLVQPVVCGVLRGFCSAIEEISLA